MHTLGSPVTWKELPSKYGNFATYPREIFRDPLSINQIDRDFVPVGTVRYSTQSRDAKFNSPRSRIAPTNSIEAKLRTQFPVDKFEFRVEFREFGGSWFIDITPSDYRTMDALELLNFCIAGNLRFKFYSAGPRHPTNFNLLSIVTPHHITPEEAWSDIQLSIEKHLSSYQDSHGVSYQVQGGWAGYKASPTGQKYCNNLQVLISVPFPEPNKNFMADASKEQIIVRRNQIGTYIPRDAFFKVQGWFEIGPERKACRTEMPFRHKSCTYHKNRLGGDIMENGSGLRVNHNIHKSDDCVCPICGNNHFRYKCPKKRLPSVSTIVTEFIVNEPENIQALIAQVIEETERDEDRLKSLNHFRFDCPKKPLPSVSTIVTDVTINEPENIQALIAQSLAEMARNKEKLAKDSERPLKRSRI